ncbi:probable beta-1,3-galactosyltransferase 13 [Physcomitrium patens]|uniref:Hexosyltransferase n=1 Tax=Physcomitrium patens TaxID=3218 RepID=A0A2K1JIK0_PHYPA|nr:probable beta-1,3-galactosyltransferase 13 [Physcomitrium patens]PNR41384.1 hypothetical protein PHYPA_018787 [Physcomitrium patens]|eukprot:XP_024393869.1 probable beta-1,3-galactosyltransferase 13 [Physcomitrella patens]
MPGFGMCIRKSSATALPMSSSSNEGGYGEEQKARGRAANGASRVGWDNGVVYGAIVMTSLVWVLLLRIEGVRDLAIFCGSGEVRPVRANGGSGYGLSYVASRQDDGAGRSGFVKLVDQDGERKDLARPKVLAFVGINTGFDSGLRRKVLRETWFPTTPEELASLESTTGLAFRFVIGHTTEGRKMKALEEEVEKHKDFMLIDIDEKYKKLNLKTLAYFRTAYALYDADFYMKIDDDIYLRPDRLATLLSKPRGSSRVYLGCMKKGPVVTDPKYKWYEPKAYMVGREYFLHAYGPIYGLSKEVVANLAATKDHMYRMFINEDVTIGVWMLAMDVEHEDNRDICATKCGPTAIAVWDLPKCSGLCNPTMRMLELHGADKCSRNPQLVE